MRLFGFLTPTEKDLFIKLISVSGIGPKGALSILDELGPDNLCAAIISGDHKAISKANGIGSKTAQKVVLELRDKLNLEGTIFDTSSAAAFDEDIRKIEGADKMKTEDIIRNALKYL